MKKITLLVIAIIAIVFTSCSKNDDVKDEFYQRPVVLSELEAGTATYKQIKGSVTYYLVFNNGGVSCLEYRNGKFDYDIGYRCKIDGDSIRFTKTNFSGKESKYSAYINLVHWGFDKTTSTGVGGDQLLIRIGDTAPSPLEDGYYDESDISLKL